MFSLKYILKQGFSSEITCIFAYKKTLKLNNNGSYFKVYSYVCVARNSCVYLRFRVFYFLFFRFLPFVSELSNFRSDKRFQIFFYVAVFDSVFQSRIFSAIDNNFFSNFSVSEFRAFQFLFINYSVVSSV